MYFYNPYIYTPYLNDTTYIYTPYRYTPTYIHIVTYAAYTKMNIRLSKYVLLLTYRLYIP